jgi:hypothetical protein
MWTWRGTINGSVDMQSQSLPMVIENFTLVNMTGGSVVANVYLIKNSRTVCISPFGNSINANTRFTDEIPRVLEPGEVVRLATTGSVDYDFELKNLPTPDNTLTQ